MLFTAIQFNWAMPFYLGGSTRSGAPRQKHSTNKCGTSFGHSIAESLIHSSITLKLLGSTCLEKLVADATAFFKCFLQRRYKWTSAHRFARNASYPGQHPYAMLFSKLHLSSQILRRIRKAVPTVPSRRRYSIATYCLPF
jgi:hypothetical protein